MATGEYTTIDISIGTYTLTASKAGISQTAEGVEVLEGQTATVNFQLGGEDMETYTEVIGVVGGNTKMVSIVPKEEPAVSVKFLDAGVAIATKTVELLTEDGLTILQTKTTDSSGVATFDNLLHGNYKVRITY